MSPDRARMPLASRPRPGSPASSIGRRADELTEREYDVLRMLALGYADGEIAIGLDISHQTATAYRSHLMRRLHLGSRRELIHYALQHELLWEPSAA